MEPIRIGFLYLLAFLIEVFPESEAFIMPLYYMDILVFNMNCDQAAVLSFGRAGILSSALAYFP